MKARMILLLCCLLAISSIAFGAVPKVMNLSGKLTDDLDNPLNGDYTFVVRIYDDEFAGTELWQETQNVTVANGKYNILLGSVTALTLSFDRAYWISLEVDYDGEMSPRIQLASAPYAIRAGEADSINGVDVVSSVDGVSNNGGDIDFIASGGITITPDDGADTITFAVSGAGGDMLKSTYDTGANNIVDNSEALNGQAAAFYLAWANFTGIPAGFADGVDDTGGGVTDHGALTGLGDDDHTQYVLVDGTRPMTGNSDFGGTDITNVTNITALGDVGIGDDLSVASMLNVGNDIDIVDKGYIGDDLYVGDEPGETGEIYVQDSSNNTTVHLDSDFNGGGSLKLSNDLGQIMVNLDAGMTDGGNIAIYDDTGFCRIQLFVNGSSGQVNINGSQVHDYSEVFEMTQKESLEPGMVVVIDTVNIGNLTISTEEYDKKVAGVISGAGDARPGFVLGTREDNSNDKPIALSGRVYCKVDASIYSIEVGDLLTTSSTGGYAMKATDPVRSQGAILGKAMEPLASGKGEILVLVTLQ